MALDFDGFDAWRSIADNPEIFAPMRAEAAKTARAALAKFVKAKTAGIGELRAVRKALGKKTFALLLDGMKDAEVKTLAARLDRHRPELKTADAAWRRRHVLDLVRGEVEPAAKPERPVKTAKAPRPPKPEPKDGEWFASAGAVRKR